MAELSVDGLKGDDGKMSIKTSACTIKDVAKLAGVSVGTTSKVINGQYVRPESREKVERAIAELGYVPNSLARSLKKSSTKTIGVMIPDISSSINGKVLRGIGDSCKELGYAVMYTDFRQSEEAELEIFHMFQEKMVDGILYASNHPSEAFLEAVHESQIPTVLIMTTVPDQSLPAITIDNEAAAYEMTKYLIENGHREILMLAGGLYDRNAGIPRTGGYMRALMEAGIPVRSELIRYGTYDFDRGYQDTNEALKKGAPFTAVFAASDLIAIGAMKALTEHGFQIPRDVSIAGFDGISVAGYMTPALSTIQQPFAEFGEEGIRMLVRMIEEGYTGKDKRLKWKLIKTGSIRHI